MVVNYFINDCGHLFQECGRSVAYFETIQSAFEFCDDAERPLVLIHSGVYRGQLIVIETNIALIGAAPGEYNCSFSRMEGN